MTQTDLFGNVVDALVQEKMESGALFSECREYRYRLWRIWDKSKPMAMFIGLNPSTANEIDTDQTITHVIKFCKRWGYGGFYMMNLFAIISSKPEILLTCADPLKENDAHLSEVAKLCQDVIFAWGGFKQAQERRKQVEKMFPEALCIGKTDGNPYHPLWAGMWAPKKIKETLIAPVKYFEY